MVSARSVPESLASPQKRVIISEEEKLIDTITDLYTAISKLPSLLPSPQVNSLFSSLVAACIPWHPSLTVSSLTLSAQTMRSHLISLCSSAESLLEAHYASHLLSLSSSSSLLPHLPLFPYFSNYLSLSRRECSLLLAHLPHPPSLVAFLGSGPLPLSSIVAASHHLTSSSFHNFDVDPTATAAASALVARDPSLSARMRFATADAAALGDRLRAYGAVFLAALVGTTRDQKTAIIDHLAAHMAPGALLVVRTAHAARIFLYPVVEPTDLRGFEVLSVYHPLDDVINSVIIARKAGSAPAGACKSCDVGLNDPALPAEALATM